MIEDVRQLLLGTGVSLKSFRVETAIDEPFHAPHRHRAFEIVWVEDGQGDHEVDFVRQPLRANQLCIIGPGQVHAWHECRMRGRVILFEPSLVDGATRRRLLYGGGLNGTDPASLMVTIGGGDTMDLAALRDMLDSEISNGAADTGYARALLAAFVQLLLRIADGNTPFAGHRQAARIIELQRLVDRHHVVERSTEFYAARIKLSARRLNQICKQLLNRTVTQLIHERLVLEARRDLCTTNKDVQAIGHRLGFDDPSYFTRFFHRETGATPHEFRKTVTPDKQRSLPFEPKSS
jgi:AraC-like DNA-binding protein